MNIIKIVNKIKTSKIMLLKNKIEYSSFENLKGRIP